MRDIFAVADDARRGAALLRSIDNRAFGAAVQYLAAFDRCAHVATNKMRQPRACVDIFLKRARAARGRAAQRAAHDSNVAHVQYLESERCGAVSIGIIDTRALCSASQYLTLDRCRAHDSACDSRVYATCADFACERARARALTSFCEHRASRAHAQYLGTFSTSLLCAFPRTFLFRAREIDSRVH